MFNSKSTIRQKTIFWVFLHQKSLFFCIFDDTSSYINLSNQKWLSNKCVLAKSKIMELKNVHKKHLWHLQNNGIQFTEIQKKLWCVSYLDDSLLISARKVLGLPLCLFPLLHHLDIKSVTSGSKALQTDRFRLCLVRHLDTLIGQYFQTEMFWMLTLTHKHTWDIFSRCLASRLSLAFWKSECSWSSPGDSRYWSTASGGLGAMVGTGEQHRGRIQTHDRGGKHSEGYKRISKEDA